MRDFEKPFDNILSLIIYVHGDSIPLESAQC